jgi:hypothetical protein
VGVMWVGTAVLMLGLVAIAAFAVLPLGQRRLQLAGLAYRGAGLGLGSIWLAYGILLLTPPRTIAGGLIGLFLAVAGSLAIWLSLRLKRPLG